MSDRPTPETDAEARKCHGIPDGFNPPERSYVESKFARKLERERDEALSDLEFRRGLYKVLEEANNRLIAANQEAVKLARTLKQERDEAREALRGILRIVESFRYSTALGKSQLERFETAKRLLESAK